MRRALGANDKELWNEDVHGDVCRTLRRVVFLCMEWNSIDISLSKVRMNFHEPNEPPIMRERFQRVRGHARSR
jgi:hypothetical protein